MAYYLGTREFLTIFCLSLLQYTLSIDSISAQSSWTGLDNRLIDSIGGSLEDDLCETLDCKKGEVCTVVDRVAQCQCRQKCPKGNSPVCATDGITYQSHCHFYMEKCQKNLKHHKIFIKGACSDNGQGEDLLAVVVDAKYQLIKENVTFIAEQTNATTTIATRTTLLQTTLSTTEQSAKGQEQQQRCEHDDFVFIPSNLLLYFHAKYAENSRGEVEHGKTYLVHLMFSNFDLDGDKVLTKVELDYAEKDERYTKLMPPGCHLFHLIQFGDLDGNGDLSNNEFYSIFGLSIDLVPHEKATKKYFMEVGKQCQLYCDIDLQNNPNARITWYRYDVPLVNVVPHNFEVSADGSLYLTPALLLHSGNFSCRVGINPSIEQKHVVHVQERPVVQVEPKFLLLKTSENDNLRCFLKKGYPVPNLSWEKNSMKITDNFSTFDLLNVTPSDTGSYKCTGSNSLGVSEDSSSVVVRDEYQQPESYLRKVEREHPPRLIVLHENGVHFYNTLDCSLNKVIFEIPENQSDEKLKKLCPKKCQWSDMVAIPETNVVYALLKEERILININATNGLVDEIFQLNHIPMRLWYVPWADSLWIESWHDASGRFRTLQAMRSASKPSRHALAHALPMHEEYDSVSNVFIPTRDELNYGYVTHWQELALHKFDLKTMKVVNRLSLAPYDCHPSDVEFVSQSGLVIVNCVKANGTIFKGQLLIDYMSDSVLNYDSGIHGNPLATPDGQFLLTIDAPMGRIFIQKIIEKELRFWQTLDEFLPLTDWTLYPMKKAYNWMLIATSVYSNQLVEVNILDGKIEKTITIGRASSENSWKRGQTIISPISSHYMIYTAENSLTVVDLYKMNKNDGCNILKNTNGTKLMSLI